METQSRIKYAKLLKDFMYANDLAQKQVAHKTGLHQQVISDLLRGNKEFSEIIITKIEKGLDFKFELFTGFSDPIQNLNNEKSISKSEKKVKDKRLNQLLKSKNETIKILKDSLSVMQNIMMMMKDDKGASKHK